LRAAAFFFATGLRAATFRFAGLRAGARLADLVERFALRAMSFLP